MRLDDENYELIKTEVSRLFKKYSLTIVPIRWEELVKKMGICIVKYSDLSLKKRWASMQISEDGYSLFNEDHYTIYYNNEKSSTRINMTIMHEIGHIVLNHTGDPQNYNVEEAEAKFFAKYALAPPALIHYIEPKSPESVGQTFDIGYEASCNCLNYYSNWKLITKGINLCKYDEDLVSLFVRDNNTLRIRKRR